MGFKEQIACDMKVFHNVEEFGEMIDLWYQDEQYTVPMIIDHTEADKRQSKSDDHSEGIYKVDCLVYMALSDLGFVPKRRRKITFKVNGSTEIFRIEKVECEDGEIILELVVLDE